LEERGETHLVLAVAVATSWTAGHDRSVVCLAHFLRTCGCWEFGGGCSLEEIEGELRSLSWVGALISKRSVATNLGYANVKP